MASYQTLVLHKDQPVAGVAHLVLNRPQKRNSFSAELILELNDVLDFIDKDEKIRVLLLSGEGEVFCAGADLEWMKESLQLSAQENIEDTKKLGAIFKKLLFLKKPVIASVHGACMGGALGLIASCDYVVATQDCRFSFSEARLGLIPAIISPFVLQKISLAHARAYFLTAQNLTSQRLYQIGLIHEEALNLDDALDKAKQVATNMLKLSPQALGITKAYLQEIRKLNLDEQIDLAAQKLAEVRQTNQAQEGIAAFLEKRKPNWIA